MLKQITSSSEIRFCPKLGARASCPHRANETPTLPICALLECLFCYTAVGYKQKRGARASTLRIQERVDAIGRIATGVANDGPSGRTCVGTRSRTRDPETKPAVQSLRTSAASEVLCRRSADPVSAHRTG